SRAIYYGRRRLLFYDELPKPWRDNPHVTSGYRYLNSMYQCMRSIVQIHNETLNIWTHLLPFFIFFAILSQGLMAELMVYGADRLFFVLFLSAACMCLLCSTIYHTFMCHCRKSILRSCVTVDYIGISLLICASVGSVIYYGFYGRTLARTIYLSLVAFVAAIGVVLPWYRWFDRSENRFARVAIFILMACSGAIPAAHLTLIHGIIPMLYYTYPLLISLGSYLVGVFIYANQYPERIWPGKFDVIGHSHQLWHLAVVGGIYFHYWATWHFYEHR
ncbi:Hly-III related protein, partial [Ramicandelaber brevisporus]